MEPLLTKRQRMKSLMVNGDFSDCVFKIGDVIIKSHKLLLACSSPVFEKMFFGFLSCNFIEIRDIEFNVFKQMLIFIYTDRITFTSVLNAWSLYYVAQKYFIIDLKKVCKSYIENHVTTRNLLLCYEYADFFDLNDLKRKFLNDISSYIRGVFNENTEYHIKLSTLKTILEEKELNINSTELMTAVLYWTINECKNRNIQITPINIIKLLSDLKLLSLIINLDITNYQYVNKLIPITILTIDFLRISDLPYTYYKQKNWSLFCKCRQIYKIQKRVILYDDNKIDFITKISVNYPVVLFGLLLVNIYQLSKSTNTHYNGEITIEISVELKPNAYWKTVHIGSFPYEAPVYIPLDLIIKLNNKRVYCVNIKYKNFDVSDDQKDKKASVLCHYMSNEIMWEKRKTVVTFNDSPTGSIIKGLSFYPV